MALNNTRPNTGLKIKKRGEGDLKKVMIYGNDGTGKSTLAEKYCKDNGLNPVVIDIDDTNYTNLDLVELDISTGAKAEQNILNCINELRNSEYDTIILDGVTSLLESLTGVGKGMSVYSERSRRWNMILRKLQSSGKHLIFIGQADMRVLYNEDVQSSKAVIRVNSMVNEKYHCYIDKNGDYQVTTEKYRVKQ